MSGGLHLLGYHPAAGERSRHASGVCPRATWRNSYRRGRLLRAGRAPFDGTVLADWHFGRLVLGLLGANVEPRRP